METKTVRLVVRKGQKWGYIDKQGNIVSDVQWDKAQTFVGGYAGVSLDESEYNGINKTNKFQGGINMDYKRLRKDLVDYYGSAMSTRFPMAIMDLTKVEKSSDDELIKIAKRAGFNLSKYKDKYI